MQCLVVDDSKSARFMLKRVLVSLGHQVILAENGESALEALCVENPDVIFMDHLMPGLDGFETSKKIRSQINFAQTPIIMCTAKDSKAYALEAKHIGISGTLPKPATEEQIKTILNKIIKRKARSTENSQQNTKAPQHNTKPRQERKRPTTESTPSKSVTVAPPQKYEIELNDQLRTLIRAEAEGRARDSAQRLLSDSWGRFRGNMQEDIRQQTRELFDHHIELAMDRITSEVQHSVNANLSSVLRQHVDKKIDASEKKSQLSNNEIYQKLKSFKRQVDLQKFDPIALQDSILEDAKRTAEYTATHKAVDTATKITRELCEQTINDVLDTSLLEKFELQLMDMYEQLDAQSNKSRALTIVASFASVLAVFSFAVAIWALI